MRPGVEFVDWGVVEYGVALERQRAMFEELIGARASTGGGTVVEVSATHKTPRERPSAGVVCFCEHPPVYTIGRSGRNENLLVGEDVLRARGATLHRVERGGDITFHGPGQIVCYPIVDLERIGLGLREYIGALEQSVIETVAEFGIRAGRAEGRTGVWIEETGAGRKICAIGVKASRGAVMHGLALNVATDLGWFGLINPCGFVGGEVTSMERETGGGIAMSEVKRALREKISETLKIVMSYEL